MPPLMLRRSGLAVLVLACTGSIDAGHAPGGPANKPDGTGPGPSPGAPAPNAVVPAGLRRLTLAQYQNTVRALLGDAIKVPEELDPDDPEATFSSVGGYRIVTSPGGVLKYEDAAYDLAGQVFADPALTQSVLGCDPRQAACAGSFVKGFGRRAWRRPLAAAEVARYTKLIDDVGKLLAPEKGLDRKSVV